MAITRTADTDDDGTGTTGTIHNNSWKTTTIYDPIDSLIGDWTSYTPTWTNGTLGNGTLSGRYCKHNKLVIARIDLTWGTTTSSAGAWVFTLPQTAQASGGWCLGVGEALDSSAGQSWDLRLRQTATTTFSPISGDGAANATVATASPFTWATADTLHLIFVYEMA